MKKCHVCNKNFTKQKLGLVCSNCDIEVHTATACSGLTAKQLTPLRAAETLQWVCRDCNLSGSRRSSFISAEELDEEEETVKNSAAKSGVDVEKLLDIMTKRVQAIVKSELSALITSVEFATNKVEEFDLKLKDAKETIKDMERKQQALKNQNTHLTTQVEALEQRIEAMEQVQLTKCIEIANLPISDNENPMEYAKNVSVLLEVEESKPVRAKRLPSRKDKKAGNIFVELADEDSRTKWLAAARSREIVAADVNKNIAGEAASSKIYVREALTNRNKHLLGKAKHDLSATYKFVWCKYGKVFARKAETDKIYWIRSESDIKSLLAKA
ncbi:hypothetical protein NE865_14950 [Phthorimaea operculella]|nr:hypothetical protein NE865_14950 [Phthorimaea operculella]